ncbi:hypothetical protein KC19_1G184600 [Ceratodon purpureus]|uniref:Uncharacterized protein n=1 Tax=Ceratodon purpureus TaxID=3225 RepID=A0A8T0J8P4_CERPU|nr:hypothetical protein KC19_1G184600 [Ceratodon purpureus]
MHPRVEAKEGPAMVALDLTHSYYSCPNFSQVDNKTVPKQESTNRSQDSTHLWIAQATIEMLNDEIGFPALLSYTCGSPYSDSAQQANLPQIHATWAIKIISLYRTSLKSPKG